MEKYLVIITTALVVTQIVRLVQNAMQLRRMEKKYKSKEQMVDNQLLRLWDKLEEVLDIYLAKEEEI